ncbi:Pentatricopeptide repeat [Dillenia turbinata]|uniref:Pentatricopeptide repeat n=1 Tax=Dillenia turbinata TaxID=194707 RepID=A0AAN8ZDG6_9MAGN
MPLLPNKPLGKTFLLSLLPTLSSLSRFTPFHPQDSPDSTNSLQFTFTSSHIPNQIIKTFIENRRYLQSLVVFKKIISLSKPDYFLFPSLLKSCSRLPNSNFGMGIHGYLIKYGIENWVDVGNSLIRFYMKFEFVDDAQKLFVNMCVRNAESYNSMICGYGCRRCYEEVLLLFLEMVTMGYFPHLNSTVHAIMACGELGLLDKAMGVHELVVDNGFFYDVEVANSLISMYVKLGRLDLGRCVFEDMHDRDLVSWNTMITGYARSGYWAEAFDLLLLMKKYGEIAPNCVTFLGLLMACGQAENLNLGKSIHGYLICSGLLYDLHLGTAIIDMYAKCNWVEDARKVFDEDLVEKNLVAWNSLIVGYSQNGYDHEAVMLFKNLIKQLNLRPDAITVANVLPAYASFGNIESVKLVHALVLKLGLIMCRDIVLGTAIMDAYGKCLDIEAAKSIFASIDRPNTASWNALISGYNLNHFPEKGMLIFLKMLRGQFLPDAITMVLLFQSCGELGSLKHGSMAHGYCFLKGFSSNLVVVNAMIDMYMCTGGLKSAELLFSLICYKSIVTWNTMLFGYVKIGYFIEALKVFSQMQSESQYGPDSISMMSFIQASAAVSAGWGCEVAHCGVVKLGLVSDTLVMNSLIDAHAKTGLIENAKVLFLQMGQKRDQGSWNVMITGCGMNGQGMEACKLLSQMEDAGYKPNAITFTSLLASCSHSGLVDEGCKYLDMMVTKYKMQPGLEHWTSIIDMFARAGRLEDAYQLINSGIYLNSNASTLSDCHAVWGALLNACKLNTNADLGQLVADKLLKLSPENCGYRTLLSNIYASGKKWDEAVKARLVFDDGKLLKRPGLSIVQS